jgi:hypothetical protein
VWLSAARANIIIFSVLLGLKELEIKFDISGVGLIISSLVLWKSSEQYGFSELEMMP